MSTELTPTYLWASVSLIGVNQSLAPFPTASLHIMGKCLNLGVQWSWTQAPALSLTDHDHRQVLCISPSSSVDKACGDINMATMSIKCEKLFLKLFILEG